MGLASADGRGWLRSVGVRVPLGWGSFRDQPLRFFMPRQVGLHLWHAVHRLHRGATARCTGRDRRDGSAVVSATGANNSRTGYFKDRSGPAGQATKHVT